MSIPKIRLPQGRNLKPQTPKMLQQNKKRIIISSSSSYSYDDEDDIPMLETLNKQSNQAVLLSSESLESDNDYPVKTVKENDWSARNKPTDIMKTPQKNNYNDMKLQKNIKNDEFSSQNSDNDKIFQIDNDNNNNKIEKADDDIKDNHIQNDANELLSQPKQNDKESNIAENKFVPEVNNDAIHNIDTNNKLLSCFIFKQSSKSKKNKYRMEENSNVIFFASESKDSKGKTFNITSSSNIPSDSLGFVRINSNHDVFTIITSEEKFNDDREGELCGIELCGEITIQSTASKIKYKKIKIVLPKNGNPYYPISKRKSLNKIVQINSKNRDKNQVIYKSGQSSSSQNIDDDSTPQIDDASLKLDRFLFFESTNPTEESEDNKSEEMKKFLINPSPKNFIIRGSDGKAMLIFYKISSGSFNATFHYPITPLIAFGISIAVISTK